MGNSASTMGIDSHYSRKKGKYHRKKGLSRGEALERGNNKHWGTSCYYQSYDYGGIKYHGHQVVGHRHGPSDERSCFSGSPIYSEREVLLMFSRRRPIIVSKSYWKDLKREGDSRKLGGHRSHDHRHCHSTNCCESFNSHACSSCPRHGGSSDHTFSNLLPADPSYDNASGLPTNGQVENRSSQLELMDVSDYETTSTDDHTSQLDLMIVSGYENTSTEYDSDYDSDEDDRHTLRNRRYAREIVTDETEGYTTEYDSEESDRGTLRPRHPARPIGSDDETEGYTTAYPSEAESDYDTEDDTTRRSATDSEDRSEDDSGKRSGYRSEETSDDRSEVSSVYSSEDTEDRSEDDSQKRSGHRSQDTEDRSDDGFQKRSRSGSGNTSDGLSADDSEDDSQKRSGYRSEEASDDRSKDVPKSGSGGRSRRR